MLYPSRLFLYLLAVCCGTAFLPVFYPVTGTLVAGLSNFILVSAGILDFILTEPVTPDQVRFDLPEEMGVGRRKTITGTVTSLNSLSVLFQVRIFTTPGLDPQQTVWDLELTPGDDTDFETSARAVEREQARVGPVQFRHRGILGLLVFRDEIEVAGNVNITPDIQDIKNKELQIHQIVNLISGAKTQKQRATEGEFDSLTDYNRGMDPRKIDWKASAKHYRMLTRKYRLEQNHHIYLALDTGRLMGTKAEGLTKLDYAINSALHLAFLALSVGDQVGMLGFDSDMVEFVTASKGMTQFENLTERANTLKDSDCETNFMRAFRMFDQKQKRRSLLVVFTDFVDRVSASLCLEALTFVQQSHVVLFVACQDVELQSSFQEEPDELLDVHQQNEVFRLLSERKRVIREMERLNISTIDTDVRKITPLLLNRYLEMKTAQQI